MSHVSNFLSGRPRRVQKKSSPPTYYVKLCVIRQWMLCNSFPYCINDSIQGNPETDNRVFVLPFKVIINIPINKSLHKKDRCGSISLPASVSFYSMLFSTHEFPMEVHLDHGKMSFSFRYNHPGVPVLFQFLSHSILLLYHLHSPL